MTTSHLSHDTSTVHLLNTLGLGLWAGGRLREPVHADEVGDHGLTVVANALNHVCPNDVGLWEQ